LSQSHDVDVHPSPVIAKGWQLALPGVVAPVEGQQQAGAAGRAGPIQSMRLGSRKNSQESNISTMTLSKRFKRKLLDHSVSDSWQMQVDPERQEVNVHAKLTVPFSQVTQITEIAQIQQEMAGVGDFLNITPRENNYEGDEAADDSGSSADCCSEIHEQP